MSSEVSTEQYYHRVAVWLEQDGLALVCPER